MLIVSTFLHQTFLEWLCVYQSADLIESLTVKNLYVNRVFQQSTDAKLHLKIEYIYFGADPNGEFLNA